MKLNAKVLGLFGSLLSCAVHVLSKECQSPNIDAAAFAEMSFNYVIIGGGTAGLALASRLAEDETLQIGVIEAGILHADDPLVDHPANMGVALGNPEYDWAYKSIAQAGLNGMEMPTPMGKMLGGSSGLNFMAWNRASEPEYDAWEAFHQGLRWNWNSLLPYLKSVTSTAASQENQYPGIPSGSVRAGSNPAFVGFHGPIESSFNVLYPKSVFTFVKALNRIGVKTNANPDNGVNTGVINTRSSIDRSRGVRSYGVQYYCHSASRHNLHVLTSALAKKVILSNAVDRFSGQSSATASGVEFTVGPQTFTVNATDEVIISAGTIQTPKILELSGIGNATFLESLNIASLVNLPQVGENLQDHLFTGAQYLLKPGIQTFDELRNNATFAAEAAAEYRVNHTGVLASVDSTLTFLPFQSYLTSLQISATLQSFDTVVNAMKPVSPLQELQYTIQREWIENGTVPQVELVLFNRARFPAAEGKSYLTVLAGYLHPVSRGSVHLNTSAPSDYPVIDPQYLNNDFDVSTLLHGLRFVLKLDSLAPLSDIIQQPDVPSTGNHSDEELVNFIRSFSQTGSHPIGTAAMGPRHMGGVVDGNLKVHGTTNLRVVDASIIPLHIGAHIQSTVYAIGEKAAAIIAAGRLGGKRVDPDMLQSEQLNRMYYDFLAPPAN